MCLSIDLELWFSFCLIVWLSMDMSDCLVESVCGLGFFLLLMSACAFPVCHSSDMQVDVCVSLFVFHLSECLLHASPYMLLVYVCFVIVG